MALRSTPTLMNNQASISSTLMNPVKEYLQTEKFSLNRDDALNSIIYGMKCDKIVDGKAHPCIIYQINKSKTAISLAHLEKNTIEFFDLKSVKLISFSPHTENLIKYTYSLRCFFVCISFCNHFSNCNYTYLFTFLQYFSFS